ncbi:murein transglycosylase A [Pseudopontixanthobacter vadosimaris]|uniref:murein transglycosylase A n=1 Tax=Pseudopontixanthobacter vadosimaris TaxID=2726450 RepID=UPI001F117E11|nr:murein transglycosylase A [Pseudopontixanthobacter vadosimaris]
MTRLPALRVFLSATMLMLLAGCFRMVPAGPAPEIALPAPVPPTGVQLPPPGVQVPAPAAAYVVRGPAVAQLGMTVPDAAAGLWSFSESCPKLLIRNDTSGLTDRSDWQAACAAAAGWPSADAPRFFATYFDTARVGDGTAFATGYFEPEILGSRERRLGYDVPVYRTPPDLIRAWPADYPETERTGRPPLGRYDEFGIFVPYFDRAAIEDGALAGRGLEIAWAADPIEFFFLQIQGSGRLSLPDGSVMRIGYAAQNGREYAGLGSIMRERGLLGDRPGQYPGSMQGIVQYLRENPEEGREMMRLNKSWIFFRELIGDGPLGALEVPVRRESSVAADPAFVPLGAPVWLMLDRPVANGLWIAQDTGGAIKGANRFDTFWGAGADAREIAGGMSARGQALLLLPKETVARLTRP